MKFYYVDSSYVSYLRKIDSKVLDNSDFYFQRPYVGIIVNIDGIKFLVPLSSPRGRFTKNKPQYHKVMDGTNLIAVLKFNNMIPVLDSLIQEIIFNNVTDQNYKNLLLKEYQFISTNKTVIKNKATNYLNRIWNSNSFYLGISNDFKALIEAMNNYTWFF